MANKLSALIKAKREAKGLSQGDLAQKLNENELTIYKWEAGDIVPAMNHLLPLSNILGVAVEELLSCSTPPSGGVNGMTNDECLSNSTTGGGNNTTPTGVANNNQQDPWDSGGAWGQNNTQIPTTVGADARTVSPSTSAGANFQPQSQQPTRKKLPKKAVIGISAGAGGGGLFLILIITLGIILPLVLTGVISCGGGRFSVNFGAVASDFRSEGFTVLEMNHPGVGESLTATRIDFTDLQNPVTEEFNLWRYNSNSLANIGYDTARGTANLSPLNMTVHRQGFYVWYGTQNAIDIFMAGSGMENDGVWRATITFDTGVFGITPPPPQRVEGGQQATRPTNPTRPNFSFVGWSEDRQTNATAASLYQMNPFWFANSLWDDKTLYAWWVPVNDAFVFHNGVIIAMNSQLEWLVEYLEIPSVINGQTVTSIGSVVFSEQWNQQHLRSIYIPATITTIQNIVNQFMHGTLREFIVNPLNLHFSSVNGMLLNRLGTTLYRAPRNMGVSSVTIPNTVTHIGPSAFEQTGISAVTLNQGLVEIGEHAFRDNNISTIVFPASLRIIEQSAFSGNSFRDVTFNAGLLEIGSWAFAGSNNLITTVILPHGFLRLGHDAFNPNSLFSMAIPSTIQSANLWNYYNLTVTFLGTQWQWHNLNIGIHDDAQIIFMG